MTDKWLCQVCRKDCFGGVCGLIGKAGHARVFCLKHWSENISSETRARVYRSDAIRSPVSEIYVC